MMRNRHTSFEEWKATALKLFAQHGHRVFTAFFRGYNAFTEAVYLASDEREIDFLLSCVPVTALPPRTALLCLLITIEDWRTPSEKILRVLLRYHVPLNLRDFDGATPLSVAIKRHNPTAVRLLLDAGADLQSIGDPLLQRISFQSLQSREIKRVALVYCINMAIFFQTTSSSMLQTERSV